MDPKTFQFQKGSGLRTTLMLRPCHDNFSASFNQNKIRISIFIQFIVWNAILLAKNQIIYNLVIILIFNSNWGISLFLWNWKHNQHNRFSHKKAHLISILNRIFKFSLPQTQIKINFMTFSFSFVCLASFCEQNIMLFILLYYSSSGIRPSSFALSKAEKNVFSWTF